MTFVFKVFALALISLMSFNFEFVPSFTEAQAYGVRSKPKITRPADFGSDVKTIKCASASPGDAGFVRIQVQRNSSQGYSCGPCVQGVITCTK